MGASVHLKTAASANHQAHHNRLDRIFCHDPVDGTDVDNTNQSQDYTANIQTYGAFEVRRDWRAG